MSGMGLCAVQRAGGSAGLCAYLHAGELGAVSCMLRHCSAHAPPDGVLCGAWSTASHAMQYHAMPPAHSCHAFSALMAQRCRCAALFPTCCSQSCCPCTPTQALHCPATALPGTPCLRPPLLPPSPTGPSTPATPWPPSATPRQDCACSRHAPQPSSPLRQVPAAQLTWRRCLQWS